MQKKLLISGIVGAVVATALFLAASRTLYVAPQGSNLRRRGGV